MPDLTRRDFLRAAPAVLLAPTLLAHTSRSSVRVALVWSPEYERARRAAEMSAAEAGRAARLLKREFTFSAVQADDLPLHQQWTGVISATSQPFDAGAHAVIDITGTTACAANLLKLAPPRLAASTPLAIWHHSLERFGAAQLNDRFRAAGITPIDDQAWLGWFAVKLLWEAGVRGRAPQAMSYDGHKGIALRFNAAGILQQPLYLVEADRVVNEIKPAAAPDQTCGS